MPDQLAVTVAKCLFENYVNMVFPKCYIQTRAGSSSLVVSLVGEISVSNVGYSKNTY